MGAGYNGRGWDSDLSIRGRQGIRKKHIYDICFVPVDKQKGGWNTGYVRFDGNYFIFCNVGIPGRTGHDYANRFEGNEMIWFAKSRSHLGQKSIKEILDPRVPKYLFYRYGNRSPFTFAGMGTVLSCRDTSPVEVRWSLGPRFVANQRHSAGGP